MAKITATEDNSLDSREEWYLAANSLESFLSQYIAAKGDKFWENQAQLTA